MHGCFDHYTKFTKMTIFTHNTRRNELLTLLGTSMWQTIFFAFPYTHANLKILNCTVRKIHNGPRKGIQK